MVKRGDKPASWRVHSFTRCTCGKRGYHMRADAKAVAKIYFNGKKQRAYQCEESGLWHLTHQSAAVRTYYKEHG